MYKNYKSLNQEFANNFNKKKIEKNKIYKITKQIINNFINKKKKFIVLKNLKVDDAYQEKIKVFARTFGVLVSQNLEKAKIIKVTPSDQVTKNTKNQLKKNRYHQTNIGGSIHTDGPQLNVPPKYLLMGCFNNAKYGGDSVVVNAEKIYRRIRDLHPDLLEELKKPVYFEKRGFYKNSKNFYLKKPIFETRDKKIIFRYLRDYIESAYYKLNINIPKKLRLALSVLDKNLLNKNFIYNYKLAAGDIIILNNHLLAHGRKGFKLDNSNKRLIYRIWIK